MSVCFTRLIVLTSIFLLLLHSGLSGNILHARALACVDGVDLALMQQAIMEQRRFFKERETKMNVQAPR